jgi:uncharacterized protein (DUF885 family)
MPNDTADREAAALGARYLETYVAREPVAATAAGDHRFDGRWPDRSPAGDAALRRDLEAAVRDADALLARRGDLSTPQRIDVEIVRNSARYWLFSLDELKTDETNPVAWIGTLGDGLDPLLTRDFAPLPARLASLKSRLDGIPTFVLQAKARLGRPARVHTETAIAQLAGLVGLVETDVPAAAKGTPDAAAIEASARRAAIALRELAAFFEKDLLPRSDADFRLGRARFTQKLRFELDDDVDPDALAAAARTLLADTRKAMEATALELFPAVFPGETVPKAGDAALVKRVLARLADERPTSESIVRDATRMLGEATEFVRKNDLVRIPPEPCRVIEMPEYRRGVSIAYCDASGPLEPKQETVFAIAPTPKDWSAERSLSFYKEYNSAMLADLVVHEAMPGHFLQLMHNNQYASRVRAVFSSGAFVEGWAVYAEHLMAMKGFGGPRVRIQREKMLLRVAANAVLDHGVHAMGLSEADALALMQREAFQEEGEAVGKWKRARLTGAQLSTYFYGYSRMAATRAAHEKRPGFTERAFHDTLLSFGSPPPRHLATLVP